MSVRRRRFAACCTVVCAWVAATGSALASPPFDLLGDTGSQGGLQARSVAGGSGAAYFNPALLIDAQAELTVGFMLLSQHLGITLDGRPGTQYAILEGLENAAHAGGRRFDNYPIATNTLQFGRMATARRAAFVARPRQAAGSGSGELTYEVVGLVVKLFKERAALGLHALIPNGEFTKMRAFFNDEREQYFSNSLHPELYSDRMTALSFALALGVELTEGLSLGVGATLGLRAGVVAPTYVVDAGKLDQILIDMNANVNIGVTPHFGLSYQPIERLRLTATAHAPQQVELGTAFTFLLATGVEQSSGVTFVLDYTPWQIGLGTTFDLLAEPEHTLAVAGTLLFAGWSAYVDRHGVKPSAAYAWSNTFSPSLGLRYRYRSLRALFDATYTPTPIPEQTGRTNYVDNDRVSGSLGGELHFRAFDTNLRIGAQAQLHHLVSRHQTKLPTPTQPDGAVIAPDLVKDELPDDAQISGAPVPSAPGLQTNNPGWPGFSSEGWIVGGTLYFAVAF
jgi:long-chain fatty acid transport protein